MEKFSKKRKTAVWIISVLIALTLAFIWVNSCIPQTESAEASQSVLDALFPAGSFLSLFDFRKAAHLAEFFALGSELPALFIALKKESYKSYFGLLPYGLYVAVTDEGLQGLTDRVSSVGDIFIDYIGYLFALAVFAVIFAIRTFRKDKKTKRNK